MNNMSIEQMMKRIDEITLKVSDPNISLEESIKLVKEAKELIAECEKRLNEYKEEIKVD